MRQHDFAGLTSIEPIFKKICTHQSTLCSFYRWLSMTHSLVKVVDIYVKRNTYNTVNSAILSCLGDITPVTALNSVP
jgi:hypothetical protein